LRDGSDFPLIGVAKFALTTTATTATEQRADDLRATLERHRAACRKCALLVV
jgi:hypothetical protein